MAQKSGTTHGGFQAERWQIVQVQLIEWLLHPCEIAKQIVCGDTPLHRNLMTDSLREACHPRPENETPVTSSTSLQSATRIVPHNPRRRWLFRAVVLLVAWLAIETVSYLLIQVVEPEGMGGIRELQKQFEYAGTSQTSQTETFHPYLGWVHNPDFLPQVDCCGLGLKTNRYGFFDSSDGIHRRHPDRLIVAIAGGSVAWQMSCAGAEALRRKLHEVPAYRDREIVFVRLAQPGYKQPQSLFALNYYLLLGGEFDIVISLDGYNELVLPTAENYPSNVALDYPQGWHARTLDIVDPRDADFSLRVFEIRGTRQRTALKAVSSPLRFLPSYQLVWVVREKRLRSELIEIEIELLGRTRARGKAFVNSGPHPLVKSRDEAIRESVRLWKQATLQMHQLCEANHILYIHAIQPNQYDPGSKPLSDYEKDKCYSDSIEYGHIVKQGYPLLRTAGDSLRSGGVRYFDLSQLFARTTDTLYVDPYCHVNHQGSEMLADALGKCVVECLD